MITQGELPEYFKSFVKLLLIIHLTILLILIFKLHHYLRSNFNIPNTVTYLVSAIPIVFLFIRYQAQLRSFEFKYLAISLILLSLAITLDLLSDGKIIVVPGNDLFEEILRIAGAVMWLIYNILLYKRIKNF